MAGGPPTARAIIEKLGLEPHPEGGWYRETWRAGLANGDRATATAIHFLLEEGQASRWHRVDADEMWLWQAGSPLKVLVCNEVGPGVQEVRLGRDILSGMDLQLLIAAQQWQAAQADQGWALVSCIVSPGFEFSGFEMAPEDWAPSDLLARRDLAR